MLTIQLDPSSVDSTVASLEAVRQRIFAGVREGMQEAMEGLAWTVADKLQGNPIVSRSGGLLRGVLRSPRVTETFAVIRGTVSAFVDGKPVGIWLEEGTHVPAVAGNLYGFTPADGDTVFTRGHRAFDVKPHPFLNPSLLEYETTITEIIAAKVAEAIAA